MIYQMGTPLNTTSADLDKMPLDVTIPGGSGSRGRPELDGLSGLSTLPRTLPITSALSDGARSVLVSAFPGADPLDGKNVGHPAELGVTCKQCGAKRL